jgi:hypothetical protein
VEESAWTVHHFKEGWRAQKRDSLENQKKKPFGKWPDLGPIPDDSENPNCAEAYIVVFGL